MHQGKPKLVLDTNIIISAGISTEGAPAKIFELLLNEKISSYTTEEILKEIGTVFLRPVIKECVDWGYVDFILSNFKGKSSIVHPYYDEKVVLRDPDDDKFINCALSVGADIVSGDKHLLELKSYKGVRIFSVAKFLEEF